MLVPQRCCGGEASQSQKIALFALSNNLACPVHTNCTCSRRGRAAQSRDVTVLYMWNVSLTEQSMDRRDSHANSWQSGNINKQ